MDERYLPRFHFYVSMALETQKLATLRSRIDFTHTFVYYVKKDHAKQESNEM